MRSVELNDKYTVQRGVVMMTGTQALVRIPLLQKAIDEAAGLNTAGFISGYRGSPLGGYDQELWRVRAALEAADVTFQPGVNEDLAATAVWGTQMLASTPQPNKDGVFAIWYGKGPGVDRSGDALKHGNVAGTHPRGGVLVVAGDDHSGKSSTVAHQSEQALMAAGMPILAPANVQDTLELGMLGIAMSRYTGLYTGFKMCNEVLEQTMTVQMDIDALSRVELPSVDAVPEGGLHNYPTHLDRQQSDVVLKRYRWPLVTRFVRANRIDRVRIAADDRHLGIVSTGKAVQDVVQALQLLGFDDAAAARAGISFYQLGCMYPVEPEGLTAFADGQQELLIVEEKEGLVEAQAKAVLYGRSGAPRIVGKRDEDDRMLIPSDVQLDPHGLALIIASRLSRLVSSDDAFARRTEVLAEALSAGGCPSSGEVVRSPYFCSGCPHNSGTRTVEGSIAAGGIGCHAMAMYSGPAMLPNTQMGGEGGHWYSLSRFSDMPHIFQNMGDGTYYHSGLLAVRGAVAAKVNMTFRILFNDAVAMTGGQPVDGPLTPGDITRQVLAEGVVKCVVVTDDPSRYGPGSGLASGVKVHHRDDYARVQRELRDIRGVTVIVYEQTCAAEKRRRRKRGKYPDPAKRMFINPAVCEGCGDCSVQSNCVSVWPKETELGRKRQIDQSNCNKDYSCVKGFCPSFITVLDAEPRKPKQAALDPSLFAGLPEPALTRPAPSFNVMISGIGGTGVVTVGALLAMAAHLEGKACSVFDMTGLSQKNGAVFSHLRIADDNGALGAQKLGWGEADLVLAFDVVAALSKEPGATLSASRTHVVANTRVTPTPAFQRNPDQNIDATALTERLADAAKRFLGVDATGLGLALLGDSIAANLFLLGYASQTGLLPVSPAAIKRAVEINGVSVPFNLSAFSLGRLQAADPARVDALLGSRRPLSFEPLTRLEDIVEHRMGLLTAYQNQTWAARYRRLVDQIAQAEKIAVPGSDRLAIAVARNFAKLMAYKDEYEVARLHADPDFIAQLRETFEDGARFRYNLAPPLFARRDPDTGHLRKREFGPWIGRVFTLLARFKFLRGTVFDPFGHTAERRMERDLIDRYEADMTRLLVALSPENIDVAVQIAELPQTIRGYGHVKDASLQKAQELAPVLWEAFKHPARKANTKPGAVLLTQVGKQRSTVEE